MRRRGVLIGVGLMLAAGIAVVAAWRYSGGGSHAAVAPQEPAVPVSAVEAKTEDVPVYLEGIGTVQALNTVAVRAQVNGILTAVPVREGDEVAKGAVLATIDPRPYQADLDRAVAQRQQDQAQLENAQLDLTRYANLARSDFASRQQVDTQRATVARLQSAVAADNAAIETAQLNLGFCTITAPFDGRVSLRQVDPGNLIEVASQPANGIMTITQVHPIAVVFTLPEEELAQVQTARAGQNAPLTVVAAGTDGRTEMARGTLLTANNAVDANTGTIQFKAIFDNKDDKLWPGSFVNARVLIDTLHGAVTVPHVAVQHGSDGLFVFTVKPDNTVAPQQISVAYDDGQVAAVSKGLTAGEKIVVSGQSRLGQGTRITLAKAESG